MKFEFENKPVSYLDTVVNERRDREETQELKLSDAMPDIGRVIGGFGQIVIRGKEWNVDSLSVSGGLMAWVFYAPEDESEIRCIDTWLPFQQKWQLPDGCTEGEICVKALLRSLDVRSVSPRKMVLRAGISLCARAFIATKADAYSDGETPEDVQILTNTHIVCVPREAGEKTFQVDEEISAPDAAKVLAYTLDPIVTEQKVMSNKIVFHGKGNFRLLYADSDGQIAAVNAELPFSQFTELTGEFSADAIADVSLMVTALEVENAQEGQLRVKAGFTAQYRINDCVSFSTVEDAYSTRREALPTMQILALPIIGEGLSREVSVEQTMRAGVRNVVSVQYCPDFSRIRNSDDGSMIELSGQIRVLYYGTDGSLYASNMHIEQNVNVKTQNEISECKVNASEIRTNISDGTLSFEIPLQIQCICMEKTDFPMVSMLEIGETVQADPMRPSVILRRANGESLWEIAKQCGASVADIRSANGLADEPTQEQMLVIPVK